MLLFPNSSNHDRKKGDKILDLVADILDGQPFIGLGKPEPLKYIAPDTWSRRIDLEHRLVYKVTQNKVYFLQARYHYESD
ncbi:MAG: Txe/YoeB family addiction module toxin [Cylindrospermopsis raciborskii KL1]|uniref:Txe/YoeB family addiction module toxin n=1 Tax=Cylindrospermopsis raciborskii TaxID=77022 RepID=UPI001A35F274|nr:Txe/YoeB family addiction module toxin [Cylindrospermopsis raciborskii]MBG0744924.1 Txe/YoeB family addiction module toxin [Cylindrospermopsis raciborskii KL1]